MSIRRRFRSAAALLAVIGAFWISGARVSAQTPAALPTAPGADRTLGTAPVTAAKASLPGDNGSPLEPYLFTFILIGGGAIGAIGVKLATARVEGEHARRLRSVHSV